jgi:hypothetical protein
MDNSNPSKIVSLLVRVHSGPGRSGRKVNYYSGEGNHRVGFLTRTNLKTHLGN